MEVIGSIGYWHQRETNAPFVRSPEVDEERMRLGDWTGCCQCLEFLSVL